jgi:tetratricopeptide (TPR) repeat protein
MLTNRALLLARDPATRKSYLAGSIGDLDYMIRNVSKNFVMLPEIHTKKGENLLHLGRATEALSEFQAAIDLKPDYWPPYVAMIDYYKSVGNLKKAREITEKGLEFSPDSKALKQRLAQLGGRTNDQRATAPPAAQKKPAPTAPAGQASPDSASQPTQQTETPQPPAER